MREASVWVEDERGIRCAGSARGDPSPGVRAAARRALAGSDTAAGPRRTIVAAAIEDGGGARVRALAARVSPGSAADALDLFAAAAPMLALMLERDELLASQRRQEGVLVAAERRATRFGLDLHDGPAQEISSLLSDLRMFRERMATELDGHPSADLILGRADDLEHRAQALEASIRELSRIAGGPGMTDGALAPALRAEVRAFETATGIAPSLSIDGPVDASTPSQRIALLRGVQEALRNAREHARATSVSVKVDAPPERLEAIIEDDGVGFDPKRVLRRAQREGRMGMGGIVDRARLLGGRCEIESRRGGHTVIRIVLPRWKPGSEPLGIL